MSPLALFVPNSTFLLEILDNNDNHIYFLPHDRLQDLIDALNKHHRCLGPQIRDGASVYDSLTDVNQLPRGVQEIQSAGSYKIKNLPLVVEIY